MGRERERELTVHVIPHTHVDPGWLQTYDGYYGRDVRPILNTVFNELLSTPNRTCAAASHHSPLRLPCLPPAALCQTAALCHSLSHIAIFFACV